MGKANSIFWLCGVLGDMLSAILTSDINNDLEQQFWCRSIISRRCIKIYQTLPLFYTSLTSGWVTALSCLSWWKETGILLQITEYIYVKELECSVIFPSNVTYHKQVSLQSMLHLFEESNNHVWVSDYLILSFLLPLGGGLRHTNQTAPKSPVIPPQRIK